MSSIRSCKHCKTNFRMQHFILTSRSHMLFASLLTNSQLRTNFQLKPKQMQTDWNTNELYKLEVLKYPNLKLKNPIGAASPMRTRPLLICIRKKLVLYFVRQIKLSLLQCLKVQCLVVLHFLGVAWFVG